MGQVRAGPGGTDTWRTDRGGYRRSGIPLASGPAGRLKAADDPAGKVAALRRDVAGVSRYQKSCRLLVGIVPAGSTGGRSRIHVRSPAFPVRCAIAAGNYGCGVHGARSQLATSPCRLLTGLNEVGRHVPRPPGTRVSVGRVPGGRLGVVAGGQLSIVSAMRWVSQLALVSDPSQIELSRTICPAAFSWSALTPRGTGPALFVHS